MASTNPICKAAEDPWDVGERLQAILDGSSYPWRADAEPPVVPSFGMEKEALKVYPGAIALADPKEIKSGMDIKTVRVEGHLPGEAEYPIQ